MAKVDLAKPTDKAKIPLRHLNLKRGNYTKRDPDEVEWKPVTLEEYCNWLDEKHLM